MLMELQMTLFIIFILSILLFFVGINKTNSNPNLPKSYPLVGSHLAALANWNRQADWITEILQNSPNSTFILDRQLGVRQLFTANPANVQHILKTHFHNFTKGRMFRDTLYDVLGNGIFGVDGDTWKFQRQVSSHEFNTKSLRKFIETVVDAEISNRLIPLLSTAAGNEEFVLDLQDVLQRFAFDNICEIAFGFDPACLMPSLPQAEFAQAFEDVVKLSSERFKVIPFVWKIKRFLGIGSEKTIKFSMVQVRNLAHNIVREKKRELSENSCIESPDLLSRFLSSNISDENLIVDIVISFILAGRDTTSAALTWFFLLISKNPYVEKEIVNEVRGIESDLPVFEQVKGMVYTHASLCESMRFYPPVPMDTKVAEEDDVMPDGTVVKKGMAVTYHPYAMGRMKEIWGPDWAEFKPERWMERDATSGKWRFVGKDPYMYPVFQAGPRICLGKDMAFLQMKRVVAAILSKFKVVPAMGDDEEREFLVHLTAKMKGGFPVKIQERSSNV